MGRKRIRKVSFRLGKTHLLEWSPWSSLKILYRNFSVPGTTFLPADDLHLMPLNRFTGMRICRATPVPRDFRLPL